jgi:Bacterial capsule synthesis protein PGA_cap
MSATGHLDHLAAAGPDRPRVAFADLGRRVPDWLPANVAAAEAEVVPVTPHWGPNMTAAPVGHVRRAAGALVEAGATLVAGHSAHVPHGVAGRVLYDLGDYRVDPRLHNDLGLLWLVTLDRAGPLRLEALPLKLEYCHTRLAAGQDAAWMRRRFRSACAALGTSVEAAGRLIISWQQQTLTAPSCRHRSRPRGHRRASPGAHQPALGWCQGAGE